MLGFAILKYFHASKPVIYWPRWYSYPSSRCVHSVDAETTSKPKLGSDHEGRHGGFGSGMFWWGNLDSESESAGGGWAAVY
jgi:hypothetical protein